MVRLYELGELKFAFHNVVLADQAAVALASTLASALPGVTKIESRKDCN